MYVSPSLCKLERGELSLSFYRRGNGSSDRLGGFPNVLLTKEEVVEVNFEPSFV